MSGLFPANASLGLHRRVLVPAITTAAVTGLLTIITCVSYPAVIFSGDLAAHLPLGIGAAFVSAIVLGVIIVLFGAYPGVIPYAQFEPNVVIAVIVATAAATLTDAGRGDAILPTIIILMPLCTLLIGGFFLALGTLRVGNLIRYAPFPVIAGFLAGVGWFLIRAAFSSASGRPLEWDTIGSFWEPATIVRWLPALVGGLVLWGLQRRRSHYMNMPAIVGVMVAAFWIIALANGIPIERLKAEGWLLGPFSEGGLWSLDRSLEAVTLAAWDILPSLLPEFATLLLITAIAFLLQASAIEIATRSDIELNRELRVTGVANLLAGLGGGLPGYHSMSGSVLTYRLGMPIRFVGLATAAICVAALIFGSTALEYLPRLAVGVILFFMGTGFLVEALGRNLIRMDRSEAGVTLLVFLVIVFAGFMAGIGVGVAAAPVIFVVNYARVPVVRSALTAETYHSNVERAPAYAQVIRSAGRSVLVLKLQGYVFFGTSNRLVDLVRERFDQAPSLRFLLLDFRTVNGIDSSATASFEKLKRYAEERGFGIIYVSVPERIAEVLRRAQVYESTRPLIRAFADADRGLEWIEDQILVAGGIAVESQTFVIAEQLSQIFPDANEAREFQSRIEAFDHSQGDVLVRQGAASDHLLIVESGRVTIALELPSGGTVRLRTMGPGTVVGEIAFYLGTPRSASVIAEADTRVYRLTRQALLDLQTSRPHVAIHFQEAMARLLAGRIVETNRLLAELNL